MAALGDELVRQCWKLLHEGQPYQALTLAERAMRLYSPPADSALAGRLLLVIGVSLAALGRDEPARRYLADASWSLANASDERVANIAVAVAME
jgi:Flp pilus assembly protein TadD